MSPLLDEFNKGKNLEKNFKVYTKLAEKEYLGNNLNSACKAFRKAFDLAKQLNNVEDMVKNLDAQASCHEKLGNFNDSINLAQQLIKDFKTSPVGYLRLGKIFRLKKMLKEAEIIYKQGLKRAIKKNPLYDILKKQLENIILINSRVQEYQSHSQVFEKSFLLSLPENVISLICVQLVDSRTTLKNFACTSSESNLMINRLIFTGGILNFKHKHNSSFQSFFRSMKKFDVLNKFYRISTFSICSETFTEMFLLFAKKHLSSIISNSKIYNLELGPFRGSERTHSLFRQCLQQGFGRFIKCLKLDFDFRNDFNLKQIFEKCKLKEFSIKNFKLNEDKVEPVTLDFEFLESLKIDGEGGCRIFSNCKSLKYLNYPNESDFNSFLSEKLICVNMRYEDNVNMRPRPIKHLGLNMNLNANITNTRVSCIDLTKYSNESIETLHLENIKIIENSNDYVFEHEYIKSSCWNQLITLRLNRILFKDLKSNLSLIFKKCPNLRILELNSIPLAGLNDFNMQENGIWLIELIFESFPNLEHLIFIEISLSPSAILLLIKKLNAKLLQLKIFGIISASNTFIYNDLDINLHKTFITNYPWSHLIHTEAQYKIYCEKFNLFYENNNFLLINY